MFEVGDKVKWTSSNTAKIGEIVAIVPSGKTPACVGHPKAGGGGLSRWEKSYVIHGRKVDRKGQEYGAKAYYWPRVSLLTKEG